MAFDFRRHTMAMHVPPGASVALKASAVVDREALPNLLIERPEAVDDAAPVATARGMTPDANSYPTQQVGETGPERDVTLFDREWLDRAMRAGQQAAPGHRDDGPPMPGQDQCEDIIDHGQAGADDENPVVLRNASFGWRGPRIGLITSARRGGLVAGRQHGHIGRVEFAIGECDGDTGVRFADRNALALNDVQPGASFIAGQQRVNQFRNVVAVNLPRRETERITAIRNGHVGIRSISAPRKPTPKMIGIIWKCAHVCSPHIEQVFRICRCVSDSASDLRAFFDNCNMQRSRAIAQKMASEKNPARSAADDDYALLKLVRHGHVTS